MNTAESKQRTAATGPRYVERLVRRLRAHISMMAPHQKEREGGKLLIEACDAIEELTALRPVKGVGPCPYCQEMRRFDYHSEEPCDDCIAEEMRRRRDLPNVERSCEASITNDKQKD